MTSAASVFAPAWALFPAVGNPHEAVAVPLHGVILIDRLIRRDQGTAILADVEAIRKQDPVKAPGSHFIRLFLVEPSIRGV